MGSLGNAAIRWHYQTQHGGVPRSLLAAVGLSELEEKWPNPILAPGTPIGPLTNEAADHLGLKPGMLVVQGGSDAFIGVIGLGVTEPGEMALITGSSHLHIGIADRVVHKPGVWGTYMDGIYPGKPIIEGGQTSTGSVIAWFKRHFAEHTSWDTLNDGAKAIPPGAEGLLVLDHFQGNRTPYTDALSRGAITGLTLKHTPAHVFRAIIEGICLGTRLITDSFGEAFTPKRIVLAGGATNSPLWLQIHADTIGAPIELTEVADAPALGCAILAAHGAGKFRTIEEGCAAMVRSKAVIEPNLANTRFYETEMLPRYAKLYGALKEVSFPSRAAEKESGQIVPQENIDPDPLLAFDQRHVVGLGDQHADGAADFVAGVLVDDGIDGAADQRLAVRVAQVMAQQHDFLRAARCLKCRDDAPGAAADVVDAEEIGLLGQKLVGHVLEFPPVVARFAHRQNLEVRIFMRQHLLEAELAFDMVAQRQRAGDEADLA